MYCWCWVLGIILGLEKIIFYIVLCEGDYVLFCIYYWIEVFYVVWMDDVKVWMCDMNCNCDVCLVFFVMYMEYILLLVVEWVDMIVIYDIICLVFVVFGQLIVVLDIFFCKKVICIQVGYEVDIYFFMNEMCIFFDYELNCVLWMYFVN